MNPAEDDNNEEEKEDGESFEVSQRYSHLANTLRRKWEEKPVETGKRSSDSGIQTIEDIKDLKYLLESELAIPVNTNIMKIALNFMEEKIAR